MDQQHTLATGSHTRKGCTTIATPATVSARPCHASNLLGLTHVRGGGSRRKRLPPLGAVGAPRAADIGPRRSGGAPPTPVALPVADAAARGVDAAARAAHQAEAGAPTAGGPGLAATGGPGRGLTWQWGLNAKRHGAARAALQAGNGGFVQNGMGLREQPFKLKQVWLVIACGCAFHVALVMCRLVYKPACHRHVKGTSKAHS
eukprot:363608-Chlamydomonas_euryale.AAC.3